jgi:AcrR family transcriptional regulator
MDRLVEETGISKTSMYKHFHSKEALILAVLQRRDAEFRDWLFRRMESLGKTPRGRMLAMFDVLEEWFEEPGFRGCLFIKAASEFQEPDHPIHAQAAAHKALIYDHLHGLAALGGAGDPALLARQLLVLKEGAIVAAQVEGCRTAAAQAKDAAMTLLDNALAH